MAEFCALSQELQVFVVSANTYITNIFFSFKSSYHYSSLFVCIEFSDPSSSHFVSHKLPVCHICRFCSHLNIYLNPEGPAMFPGGRIKPQQNMVGAEKTLLSREHAHAPSFGSDCSKGFEGELTPSAPQAPAACSVLAWMGLVPDSSRQDGSQKKTPKKPKQSPQQPFTSYNQFEGGTSLCLNPCTHSKWCMSSKLTYHTVINS